jgi:hypothetical protein
MIGWIVVASVVSLLASSVVQAGYYDLKQMLPSPAYKEKEEEEIVYANMVQCRQIHMENITGREEMTPGGGPYLVSSTFEATLELSTDGGGVYTPILAQGEARWLFTVGGGGGGGGLLAEIKLDYDKIFRGNLPPGVEIRESPTLDSTGMSTCTALAGPGGGGGGGYIIDSFFDIFTEVSLDGGLTWTPADGPMHMIGTPEPATLCLLGVGAVGLLARWRRK